MSDGTKVGVRRVALGCVAAAATAALSLGPGASAALADTPQCNADALANTLSTTTGAARDYLNAHPDANQAVSAAESQPRPAASANLRSYFNAHPQEYFDLRGILAPIGSAQQQCNVTLLPPDLASAYGEFMAG